MNDNTTEFQRGWEAATDDLHAGITHIGDSGFQPPKTHYQKGYNARIEAQSGTDAIGLVLVLALGIGIIAFATMVYHSFQP